MGILLWLADQYRMRGGGPIAGDGAGVAGERVSGVSGCLIMQLLCSMELRDPTYHLSSQ